MPHDPKRSSKRVLEPIERISEFLFGVIMVLIATCTFRVMGADRGNVRTMLVEALGCNIAWGIIDAFFFLLACLGARGQGTIILRRLRKASDPDKARQLIGSALPPLIESVITPQQFESLTHQLIALPEPPARPHLTREDWIGALAVFLLVFLAIFPLVVPFILIKNDLLALRISNVIAIYLMFIAGYSFGRFTGSHPWRAGLVLVVLGLVVVGIAVLLGG
jgi:VIT family